MTSLPRVIRWWVKKTVRCGLALASFGSGYLTLAQWLTRQPKIRVLTYHRFGPCDRDPFTVEVQQFEEQMRWLAGRKLAISLADLEEFLAGRRDVPNGSVVVTVDDGYQEVASVALPICRRYGIPAVVFVPTAEIAETEADVTISVPHRPNRRRLSAEELKALPETWTAIGSHSWQHRSLGRMRPEEAWLQITRSRRDLELILGRPITAFAYPFGTRKDFNPTTARLLAKAGYRLGFTSQHGAITLTADPHALPRIKVEGGEPLWMFRLLVTGALDSWLLVDRSLWWLQQSDDNHPTAPPVGSVEHA